MAFHFVNRWQLEVKRYLSDYGDDCAATYNAAYTEDEADIVITNPLEYIVVGQHFVASYEEFRICRGLCTYDLSDLSPSEDVIKAVLTSIGAGVKGTGIYAYIYDGTGLTGIKADFSAIGALSTVLGLAYIPDLGGYDDDYPFKIEFNSAGLSFLESKAGGIAILAFKVNTDGEQPGSCPTITGYEEFFMQEETYLHKLHINPEPGYIWVEGIYLAYLDGNYLKRLKQGTTTGITGKIAGQCGVKPSDTYFRYIDNAGAERIIEGNLYASQGKIPGQIGIRSDFPSYLHYIDGYGDERSFMGEIAS